MINNKLQKWLVFGKCICKAGGSKDGGKTDLRWFKDCPHQNYLKLQLLKFHIFQNDLWQIIWPSKIFTDHSGIHKYGAGPESRNESAKMIFKSFKLQMLNCAVDSKFNLIKKKLNLEFKFWG